MKAKLEFDLDNPDDKIGNLINYLIKIEKKQKTQNNNLIEPNVR